MARSALSVLSKSADGAFSYVAPATVRSLQRYRCRWRDFGFTRNDVLSSDGRSIWREVVGRAILSVDLTVLPDRPFHSNGSTRSQPEFRVALLRQSGLRIERTCDLLTDGTDDLALRICPVRDWVSSAASTRKFHPPRDFRVEQNYVSAKHPTERDADPGMKSTTDSDLKPATPRGWRTLDRWLRGRRCQPRMTCNKGPILAQNVAGNVRRRTPKRPKD